MRARIAALTAAKVPMADSRRTTSEIAGKAATALFAEHGIDPRSVDYLILCTQSPDFALPTTACLVQDRVGMRTDVGAVDITLGSSGFVYALALAKGLIETGQVQSVLVVTAETRAGSPDRGEADDAAAATLVIAEETDEERIGGFVLGTDREVGADEIFPGIGLADVGGWSDRSTDGGTQTTPDPALGVIGPVMSQAAAGAGLDLFGIDHVVLQRADEDIVAHLRELGVRADRLSGARAADRAIGSCALPVALDRLVRSGAVQEGDRIMLVGFAAGHSWGAAVVTW